ncbi:hypothetical protein Tco_1502799 [Tanacetum coccineum]
MNPQETQVAGRDEKWVPFTERVKISSTNIRLETTVPQKEETFQVVIDLVKNSSCYKAFTISADVPEIFMQQFWYSIKKVQGMDSYEFILANKKCVVNSDSLGTILISVQEWKVENVDYLELIWEDLDYQIDHKKEKRSRRENMSFPRFTKVTINHFPKQYNSLSNLKYQHYHTIKDDGIVCRSKFVRIGEDYQEYGLSIPETMLTEAIKQSKSYQMFIKYSTVQIRPKKSRGKGSQRKKTVDDSQETVDVFEESKPEPESVKRKTSKLGKSISQTEAEEAEEARQVHATHARIVTKFVSEPIRRRKSGKILCKLLRKVKRQERDSQVLEAQVKELVLYQGFPMGAQSSLLPQGSKQKSEYSEEDKLDDEEKDDKEEDKLDDEDDETKSDEDDIYKYKIRVCKDEDEEMINAEVDDSNKGGEKVIDAVKADDEKTSEVKDDPKKTKLPPTSSIYLYLQILINSLLEVKIQSEVPHTQSPSMLSVPISVISKPTVLTPLQESPSIATVTTLPPLSVSTTPSVTQQTKTLIPTPTITTDAPIITTAGFESDALSAVQLRATKLEKDVSDLKKIDLFAEALAALKTQVPSVVDNYLGSKVRDVFQKELKKRTTYLIQKYYLQKHDVDEHDDDEDPLAGPHQGKALSKGSKTSKSTPVKEPVEEPITEVVMDDAGNDVVHDEDQPQDASEPKTTKTPNPY